MSEIMPTKAPRSKRAAPTSPPSEGARLLRAASGTLMELANRLGANGPGVISDYRSGRRVPNPVMREQLSRTLGIPAGSWDDLPEDLPAPPQTEELLPTMDEVIRQLRSVRTAQQEPDLSPSTRARLASEVRSLLRLRATLEREAPLDVDRVARSAAFIELRDKIIGAIKGCKGCSSAVAQALGGGQ